ncbi:hypothetical protein [Paraburkholderia youngii]|uniref:hypothetical protein n=1 Tax=Paraburkholderia youngii TaxID=2782701 RepID=UPI003D1A675A
MESTLPVRVPLPVNWFSRDEEIGTIITARALDGRFLGSITVSTKIRGFAMGVCAVTSAGAKGYSGRFWEFRLFRDAIDALRNEIEHAPARM